MSHQSEAVLNTNVESLVKHVKTIISHQDEVSKLRGESFNVFSILNMEKKENGTHSAFLGELLNPNGSHMMGSVFLDLFLETVNHAKNCEQTKRPIFNTSNYKLKLEKTIGVVNLKKASGGRIDIYLEDNNGNIISIENKIDAPPQPKQILRYFNHKTHNNTVYYLSKMGDPADASSAGGLMDGEDYFSISYSETIVEWLEKSLKECISFPIVRETLRQYIIVLKKITNQLIDNQMSKQISGLIRENYQSIKAIESVISMTEMEETLSFLQEVKAQIQEKLNEEWSVSVDPNLNEACSGLRIQNVNWDDGVIIKLEGNTKIPWNNNLYGIVANSSVWNREIVNERLVEVMKLYHDYNYTSSKGFALFMPILDLSTTDKRSVLFDDRRPDLVADVSDKLIELCEYSRVPLSNLVKA